MPWVRYEKDHDFRLTAKVTRAYKAGKKYLVSQRAADEAVAQGKGKILEREAQCHSQQDN